MKYSILTYDFGNYDVSRPPKEVNPDVSYVFVTDKDNPKEPFKKKILNINERNPLFKCQYVKHHPFEFVDTEWVVVMDASIEIQHSLDPIVEFCKDNDIEALFVSSPYATTIGQEMVSPTWTRLRKVNNAQRKIQLEFMKQFKEQRLNIEGMFYVLKNTDMTKRLFESVVSKCKELRKRGSLPRPCQVLYSATVANEFKDEVNSGKIAFMTSWQIRGGGTMMKIYEHGRNCPIPVMKCRSEVDILGKITRPYDFKQFDKNDKPATTKAKAEYDDDWED